MMRSAVVHEPLSVSVNVTRPDWLNTQVSASCVNYAKRIAAIISTLKLCCVISQNAPNEYLSWSPKGLTSPINGNAMESAVRH